MNRLDTKYRLKGVVLLALYLMMLMVSALHTHECHEESFVCQDCLNHVEHNAHVSETGDMDFDCILCKIIHTTYIFPEALVFLAAALLVELHRAGATRNIVKRKSILPSLRAPPAIC